MRSKKRDMTDRNTRHRSRYTLLTLTNSSVATPSVISLSGTTTYEIGGGTTITLSCYTTTAGVTYSWKDDGVDM